uniref:Si:dkey-181m9.8 n=1 Tax=Sinocyclocheilus anshuiensis TaxID=1608454 RepID=A0A671QPE9_9TELE
IDDLFKSLQLQRVVNMYQLSNRERGAWQDCGGGVHSGLVDDRHKVVVSRLPVGVSPSKMKNKLTLFFQRRQNAGGEVLDVKYPAAQPDQAWVLFRHQRDAEHVLRHPVRVITINEQQFPIQLKSFEDMEVRGGQIRIALHRFFTHSFCTGLHYSKNLLLSILSLEGCSFSSTDVLEAVQSCRDLPSALKYLCHDCPICQEQISFNRMVTMTHCSCTFCESCFKKYFSSVIKEKNIVHAVCPLCNLPDVQRGRREESMEYFSLLDTQIRYYLDPQIHELFQRKLRDQALQEMPNFRWCAHCCFGLLHEADRLRMDCPSCGKSTCFQCKRPWAPQHEGISCEKFKEWEQLNSPEYQNSRLEQLLSRNKIDCPKCKFRFFLARGGCLHFKCTQCQHEFCGGCSQPFKQGSACSFSTECGAKGLHAHHPRNCLYHLRDWSHKQEATIIPCICGVMEFQESGAVKEEPCGRPALPDYSGYCTVHYKECLVELINNNALDPVVLLDGVELRAEMDRWKVPVPDKQPLEPDQRYEDRLRQVSR